MRKIHHDGDTWRVLSEGVTREDGMTFCHLASATRFRAQKNGVYPVQINDWISLGLAAPGNGEVGGDGLPRRI